VAGGGFDDASALSPQQQQTVVAPLLRRHGWRERWRARRALMPSPAGRLDFEVNPCPTALVSGRRPQHTAVSLPHLLLSCGSSSFQGVVGESVLTMVLTLHLFDEMAITTIWG
jgi:hypothetical protein